MPNAFQHFNEVIRDSDLIQEYVQYLTLNVPAEDVRAILQLSVARTSQSAAAFRLFRQLITSVADLNSLHDCLWRFVATMERTVDAKSESSVLYGHPAVRASSAGPASHLGGGLHSLLGTIIQLINSFDILFFNFVSYSTAGWRQQVISYILLSSA